MSRFILAAPPLAPTNLMRGTPGAQDDTNWRGVALPDDAMRIGGRRPRKTRCGVTIQVEHLDV